MFFKKGLGGAGAGLKAKIEITKVKGKNVKNEFSHCLTYFFLVYCGKLQDFFFQKGLEGVKFKYCKKGHKI